MDPCNVHGLSHLYSPPLSSSSPSPPSTLVCRNFIAVVKIVIIIYLTESPHSPFLVFRICAIVCPCTLIASVYGVRQQRNQPLNARARPPKRLSSLLLSFWSGMDAFDGCDTQLPLPKTLTQRFEILYMISSNGYSVRAISFVVCDTILSFSVHFIKSYLHLRVCNFTRDKSKCVNMTH